MNCPGVCAAMPPPSFSHRSMQRLISHSILFAADFSVAYSAVALIFLDANLLTRSAAAEVVGRTLHLNAYNGLVYVCVPGVYVCVPS